MYYNLEIILLNYDLIISDCQKEEQDKVDLNKELNYF